jgi:pimeloyl-ACP methyl ester carboxylesterase
MRRFLLLPFLIAGCLPEPLPATGTQRVEPFHSEIAGDDYVLRVRLPPGYEGSAERYPLVVQLDPTYVGLKEYETTVGFVSHYAAEGEWPEAVVVGVDYPDPFTRERDYRIATPADPEFGGEGADRFYRVLRDEILPWTEERYRVDPARRILVGHSNGAVFAWYAALRHAPPEPPLFSGIVAADCGYDEVLFTMERWHAERSPSSLPVRLYASRAVYNGALQELLFREMIDRLRARAYPDLHVVTEELETDHGGAIFPSFERGLDVTLGGAE